MLDLNLNGNVLKAKTYKDSSKVYKESMQEVLDKYGLEVFERIQTFLPYAEKIAVFSHNDLDGVYISEILKRLFKKELILNENCSYKTIDKKIKEFVDSPEYNENVAIWIFDIGVNKEVEGILEDLYSKGHPISLIDHHDSNIYLNEHSWSNVFVSLTDLNGVNQLESGTSLGYLGLKANGLIPKEDLPFWNSSVELVRDYDTWTWVEKENYFLPEDMNLIFFDRKYSFSKHFLRDLYNEKREVVKFPPIYQERLKEIRHEMKLYSKSRLSSIQWETLFNKKTAFVYADRYPQEVVNKVVDEYPEVDVVSVLDVVNKKGNLRSRKEGVQVLDIAKMLGGGGHPQSAGFLMSQEVFNRLVKYSPSKTGLTELSRFDIDTESEVPKEIRAQIKYRLKTALIEDFNGFKITTIFSDTYHSETGSYLLTETDTNAVFIVDIGLQKGLVFGKDFDSIDKVKKLKNIEFEKFGVEFFLTEENFNNLIKY